MALQLPSRLHQLRQRLSARWSLGVVLAVLSVPALLLAAFVSSWIVRGLLLVPFLIGMVVLWRQSPSGLLGPVWLFHLKRTTRRAHLHRCAYALLLLGAAFFYYKSYLGKHLFDFEELWTPFALSQRDVADFAEWFFLIFLCVQYLFVAILTPIQTAGALLEERDRGTLDLLLTSDLRSREIILGKLAAHLAYVALVILTGLPIPAALMLLGGVDPRLLLLGFASTLLTMVSLGCVAMFLATRAKGMLEAVSVSCFWGGIWLLIPGSPLYIGLLIAFSLYVMDYWDYVLLACIIIHSFVTMVLIVMAMRRLRERKDLGRVIRFKGNPHSADTSPPPRFRAPVDDQPVLWKEMHTRRGFTDTLVVSFLFFAAGLLAYVGTTMMMSAGHWAEPFDLRSRNEAVQWLTAIICAVLFFTVGLSASGRVTRERQRQTLDGLLITLVGGKEILAGKWRGAIAKAEPLIWALASVWTAGVFTGAVHLLALPFMFGAAFLFVNFFALLGLWFSTVCRTTARATTFTALTCLLLIIGPWLAMPLFDQGEFSPRIAEWGRIQAWALSPPASVARCAFSWSNGPDWLTMERWPWVPLVAVLAGWIPYLIACKFMPRPILRLLTAPPPEGKKRLSSPPLRHVPDHS